MEIKPLNDRVLIRPIEEPTKTESGIFIPESAKKKTMEAEVIAVGPGKVEGGQVVPIGVDKGDRVLYEKYGGTEIEMDGDVFLMIKSEDLMAVIKR